MSDLNKRGIFQWNENYPNSDSVAQCIDRKEQYLLQDGSELIGTVVLNEVQADEWSLVNWLFNEDASCVIHGLVIDPIKQGRGYGKRVLKLCEEHAKRQGYTIMRLDVFPENTAAVGLYQKFGYIKRGEVSFDYKPPGHQEYHCYEKRL